jgi:hypothetical protein
MTDKLVFEPSSSHLPKACTSSVNTPASHLVRCDQPATSAFQPDMFDDDLVSALAVAKENVRARQVFDWERVRRQCAV